MTDWTPLHYTLHLEPNLHTFTFDGYAEIDIQAAEPISQIVLHALDLAFDESWIEYRGQKQACTLAPDTAHQQVIVHLPQPVDGPDPIRLSIAYRGTLNDDLVGFYRSRYEHQGQTKYLAVTQFAERDARRAFPCLDHPAQKATFDLELLIDPALTAIANTPIKERVPQGDRALVRFERTPKMSTYLLFWAVGDLECIKDDSQAPTIRLFATPGKTQYGRIALEMGRQAMQFCADYTGIPFAMPKCDHIAVPDFRFGAMENYGAIAYRENRLLFYPGISSLADHEGIASVVAHETSHMWFGDLVSPADWKYLWLNESFATYFATLITDHHHPEWQLWDTFAIETRLAGLERDSLYTPPPVELPGDQEIVIDPSSAPIIYSKGAAILHMLADYLGEQKLKQGIHTFLSEHAFDCATSQQYWQAFQRASGEPVKALAESWVYQAGYPIVRARQQGHTLHLFQQHFTYAQEPNQQLWTIPLHVELYFQDGTTQTVRTLMDQRTAEIPLPANVAYWQINPQQTGFYRVQYETSHLYRLGRQIQDKRLSAISTFGIENDLFALLKKGSYSLTDYFAFVGTHFAGENRFLPLYDLAQNLLELYWLLPEQREQIAQLGKEILEPPLIQLGFEPQPGESLQTAMLRAALLQSTFVFGSQRVAQFGAAQFRQLMDGQPVPADILSSVHIIGAATELAAFDFFVSRLRHPDATETEQVSILNALGHLKQEKQLRQALALTLQEVPKKNKVYPIRAAARNPVGIPLIWPWFQDHVKELRQLHPSQLARVILHIVPISELDAQAHHLLDDLCAAYPTLQSTVEMALQLYQVYKRLRASLL